MHWRAGFQPADGALAGSADRSWLGNNTFDSHTPLHNDGQLIAGGDLMIHAPDIQSSAAGTVAAGVDGKGNVSRPGSVSLKADLDVGVHGKVVAHDNIGVNVPRIDLSKAQVSAGHTVSVKGNQVDSSSARMQASSLDVTAKDNVRNRQGHWQAERVKVKTPALDNQGGRIVHTGKDALSIATVAFDNTRGLVAATQADMALATDQVLGNTGGTLSSQGKLILNVQGINSAGGTVDASKGEYKEALKSAGLGGLDLLGARAPAVGTAGVGKAASAAERVGLEGTETATGIAKAERMAAEASVAAESSPKTALTGTEPVKALANGGAPYLSAKQALLAQESSANEVGNFSSGISFNIKIPQHLSKVETMNRRGIVGGHNMVEFENFAEKNNLLIVGRTKILEGIYEFEYRAPSLDRALNFTGEYKSPKVKTVYDPAIYSDKDMLRMGQVAADKGYRDAIEAGERIYDSSHEGVNFRVFIDKNYEHGMVDNFFPSKDLYK